MQKMNGSTFIAKCVLNAKSPLSVLRKGVEHDNNIGNELKARIKELEGENKRLVKA
jgi:hypothetical protein